MATNDDIFVKKKLQWIFELNKLSLIFCSSYKIFKKKAIIRLAPLWLLSEKKNKSSKEFALYFLDNGDSLQDGKQRGG